ncbi:helix-turn-helix domain-containing protein [Micromonospora sp. NPDC047707]|uniref:helix-turn-helix domain-containing protein n=1 Tax=Micromonospora sp. NPDC047707 TaxID=3154498 RepID=UPI003452A95A
MTTSLLPDLLGTAPADLIAADITRPPATRDEAKERLKEIKKMAPTFVRALRKISDAYACRDWQALGYGSWKQYRDAEFGELLDRAVTKERREAVAELRAKGMSVRDIAAVVRASVSTVHDDIARCSGPEHLPDTVTGADGKTYASTRPTPPPAATAAGERGPAPHDRVWIATARQGIEAHGPRNATSTYCGRSTRTGLTLPARQAAEQHEATWCRRCWPNPADHETTRFAAGEPVHAGPDADTHDPRVSGEAGAEIRGSAPASAPESAAGTATHPADGPAAGDATLQGVDQTSPAGPAPAPPPASSAGGAGVTPDPTSPVGELTLAQIGRLHAVFEWARAGLACHPRDVLGRGKRSVLGMEFGPSEPTPPVPQHVDGPVEHVEVWWEDGELCIVYRSARYIVHNLDVPVASVDQAIDVLCALGILPARLSSQYAAGARDGMRAGDAIDGELLEEVPAGA